MPATNFDERNEELRRRITEVADQVMKNGAARPQNGKSENGKSQNGKSQDRKRRNRSATQAAS
jgi:hypothetical protein